MIHYIITNEVAKILNGKHIDKLHTKIVDSIHKKTKIIADKILKEIKEIAECRCHSYEGLCKHFVLKNYKEYGENGYCKKYKKWLDIYDGWLRLRCCVRRKGKNI